MTDDYLHLPIGDKAPEIVTAVIEIPQDSVNKYEYDKHLRVFRLDRNLHSPIHYPGDYGFAFAAIRGSRERFEATIPVGSGTR